MAARRRSDDNMRLYDFAKKYQENQNSSDLVKKQNAAEDKVLTARLEYLNNQKELAKKTLEKEIQIIRRNCSSGHERFRKSASSHHLDRAVPPNNTESTRGSLSTRKCSITRCLSLPQIKLRTTDKTFSLSESCNTNDEKTPLMCALRTGNDSGTALTMQAQKEDLTDHEETAAIIEEPLNTTFRMGNSKQDVTSPRIDDEHSKWKRTQRQTTFMKSGVRKTGLVRDSASSSDFGNNEEVTRLKCSEIENVNPYRTRLSCGYTQPVESQRQECMRKPTPFPKLGNEKILINAALVRSGRGLTDRHRNQLRFSRTMSGSAAAFRHSHNQSPVAVKDLRFKKLESVLVQSQH